jgi:predicted alpha/beta-fold hydrolase
VKHHWYKSKVNWLILGASVASSAYATHEIHSCRQRNDIIHCPDGGYGAFKAREELRLGVSLGTAMLTVYGREHWRNGWKNELMNDLPATSWASWNLAVGISDHNVPTFPKVDLTSIHITK